LEFAVKETVGYRGSKYRTFPEDIQFVGPNALVAGLLAKVLVPNALPVAFGCPNKPVFDVAG
jgi:hypothetical protein